MDFGIVVGNALLDTFNAKFRQAVPRAGPEDRFVTSGPQD